MNRFLYVLALLIVVINATFSENADKINDVDYESRNSKSDDLLWDMLDNCVNSEVKSVSTCLKVKVRN